MEILNNKVELKIFRVGLHLFGNFGGLFGRGLEHIILEAVSIVVNNFEAAFITVCNRLNGKNVDNIRDE